jgi:tetratricopeptide (TPR) repeat protein
LDLLVKNRLGPQVRVFANDCAEGRKSIAFTLKGSKSNRDGIGARVEVDGKVKFVNAGSGYLSQHTKRMHFGLGNRDSAGTVRIAWPSGEHQEFHNLSAGFVYMIEEGSTQLQQRAFETRPLANTNTEQSAPVNKPSLSDTWLLDPVPLPDSRKGPALFCIVDAPAALPAGQPSEVLDARSASEETMAAYALFQRYLFDWRAEFTLPLLLLTDERGMARKIYAQMPDARTLSDDLKAISGVESWRLALPLGGEYIDRPGRNYFKLGAAFYWSGYPEHALRYLDEVVRRTPENAVALMAVGQIHMEANRFDLARDFANRALKVNPKLAGAWNCLGGVEAGQGRLASALEYYQRAISLQPDLRAAIINAAQMQERLGRLSEAEVLCRRALELDPADSDIADRLGLLLAKQGKNSDAKQWLQKAIELKKDNPSPINNLGVLYMQTGQPNDAIAAFEYGIKVAPDNEMLYFNLAKTYVRSGDRARAKEVLERLLARKPGNATALRALTELQ